MEIKLKHVLIGLGILTGGGLLTAWALRDKDGAKVAVPGPIPSPGPPPMAPGPGQIGVTHPTWNQDAAMRAAEIIAAVHQDMGSPSYTPDAAVSLAWTAANEIWPDWSWPTNPFQSSMFLQSEDLGVPVWQNLLGMAQDQMGYRPIT